MLLQVQAAGWFPMMHWGPLFTPHMFTFLYLLTCVFAPMIVSVSLCSSSQTPPWACFCWKCLPVKKEFFFPAVAKCCSSGLDLIAGVFSVILHGTYLTAHASYHWPFANFIPSCTLLTGSYLCSPACQQAIFALQKQKTVAVEFCVSIHP